MKWISLKGIYSNGFPSTIIDKRYEVTSLTQ